MHETILPDTLYDKSSNLGCRKTHRSFRPGIIRARFVATQIKLHTSTNLVFINTVFDIIFLFNKKKEKKNSGLSILYFLKII